MQLVSLYGAVIEMSAEEAEGVLAFVLGCESATEAAPLGFAFTPIHHADDWRTGYAMAALEIGEREQLEI